MARTNDRLPRPAISAVEVRLLDLPLVEPFAASHGTTRSRILAVLLVEAGDHHGWGECSALPAATYTAESAAGCHRLLAEVVGPALVAGGLRSAPTSQGPGELAGPGGPNGPGEPNGLEALLSGRPMARSAVEMALLDLELRAAGRSLAEWLGATREHVPAGVSLGLDRPAAVVARARELVLDGFRRLKVKIQPGHDREVLDALRADRTIAEAGVELHLDANGAYQAEDLDLIAGLAGGSGRGSGSSRSAPGPGADALEQPFDPGDVESAAALVARLARAAGPDTGRPVPVVADEAVTTAAEARALADRGALTGISIKPARVGGLSTALELHDLCRHRGLAATAGGMLESGLGRHALAALAGLPGFDLTGDLSPAGRWLAADPWPDLTLIDGRIAVPTGPGVAPDPDPELLERHTVGLRRLEAGR